jgi:uncharacterized protein YjbJ (UPF0337 family)
VGIESTSLQRTWQARLPIVYGSAWWAPQVTNVRGVNVNEGESSGSATEQVSEKAQELAGQAQQKAGELAAQARPRVEQAQDRVREEIDRRSTTAGEQMRSVAGVLRHTSDELRSRGNDPHAKIAEQVADRMDRAGGYLSSSSADDLLADIEELGRRQPLLVVAGGALIGLAAARFLKASSERRYGQQRFSGDGGYGAGQLPARADAGAYALQSPPTPPAVY